MIHLNISARNKQVKRPRTAPNRPFCVRKARRSTSFGFFSSSMTTPWLWLKFKFISLRRYNRFRVMHTHYILCTYMRQTMTYTSLMKYCTHIIPYTARRSYIHPYHNTHLYYVCTLLTVYFALKPSQPCIITQSHNFQHQHPAQVITIKTKKKTKRCLLVPAKSIEGKSLPAW